jgi:hypothetical protein
MHDLETVTEALRPVWWDLIRRQKVSAADFVGAQINVCHDEFVQWGQNGAEAMELDALLGSSRHRDAPVTAGSCRGLTEAEGAPINAEPY